MRKFLWVLTVLGCVVGGLIGLAGVVYANGAPQEAAAAAIAVACAVIPYCLARAGDELDRPNKSGPENRKCPYCAESIKKKAEICKFCNKELPSEEDLLPERVVCPACGRELELFARQRIERKYECGSCGEHISTKNSEIT